MKSRSVRTRLVFSRSHTPPGHCLITARAPSSRRCSPRSAAAAMIASDSATYSGHAENGSPTGWVACSTSAHREGEVLDALLRIEQDERSPEHALVVLGSRVDAEGPPDLDPRRAIVDAAVQGKQRLPLPDRLEHRGAPHGDYLQAPALDRGLEVLVEL